MIWIDKDKHHKKSHAGARAASTAARGRGLQRGIGDADLRLLQQLLLLAADLVVLELQRRVHSVRVRVRRHNAEELLLLLR